MADEKYIESIIMRIDNMPETETTMFTDDDCDKMFKFKGVVQLKQIIKNVQNATHNNHSYVFTITQIDKLQEE